MQINNKLRLAIRATAATAILSVAGQAQAFDFSAGDVDASVYGYTRLNMSYDIDENLADPSQSGDFSKLSNNGIDGHFGASAYQSRIGVKATNASGVMINVEGDFLGSNNNLRLRHAYGSYKGILAGQTWSNHTTFVGSTPTLDFGGLVATAGYQSRVAQLRYTTGPASFSIEDPKGEFAGTAAGTGKKDGTPAFTARFDDKSGSLSYAASAVVKQNSYDIGTADDTTIGFGVFGAAKIAITDMISIQGAINYADGATGYIYRSGGKDAYLDNGDLKNLSGVGGTIGTSVNLGGGSSINISYGVAKLDVDDLASPTNDPNETNENAFINYQWTPAQSVMMGIEYGYYSNETQGGSSEDANRLMFAAQYNF
jgi:hypothetical protein